MADYNINADITADASGYEAGVKKAQKASKSLSKSISGVIQGLGKNGLVGALGSIGLASAGLSATFGAVVKIARNVSKAIDECTEAYKKQNIAEISLKTAMQNNPLTNGQGTKQLREFASEMQRTSNMGDEELIPFMTQLIASGRTEAETMKIIKTASDMASSGAMSFDTAVTQLNATLNGNIGRLGQQNAELKGLTEEELKSGRAVDILAEKYKGLTEATIDTKKQLQNAIGDLRESFGTVFEKALSPMRKFFAEIIQGWADARKAKQEYEGAVQAITSGNADIEQLQIVIDANQKKLEEFNKKVEQKAEEFQKDREEIIKNWVMYLNSAEAVEFSSGDLFGPKQAEELERQNTLLNGRIRLMNKIAESEEKVKQKKKEGEEAEAKRLEIDKKTNELKEEYLKKIAEQEERWQHIKEVTGEEVSNEEKIKFYQDSLVDLMTQAGGQITTNNELYKDQMAIIQKLTEGLEGQKKALADIASWESKLRQQEIDRVSQADKDVVDYGAKRINLEKIFKLNTEQLEAQMQADLKGVEETENAEEAKAKIVEYYNNEKLSLTKDYNEQLADLATQEEAEIWDQQQEQMQKYFKTALSYAEKISGAFKKMATAISNAITSIFSKLANATKSLLQKIFTGNIDDLLDSLLRFEDKILTFFVETMPQLPAFFESALQSLMVLVESVLQVVTPQKVGDSLISIMKKIGEYAPKIIDLVLKSVMNIADGLIKAIPDILSTMNTVVKKIAEVLPKLIQVIINVLIEILKNPKEVTDLIMTIINAFVEIFKVLMKNIGPLLDALLPVIGQLIVEIVRAIPSILGTMASALGEAVVAIGKHIINLLIDVLNNLLKGLSNIWTWIPGAKGLPTIPHLATGTDNAKKGLTLVGEAGPELVNFRGGEQVLNNHNTQKALAGMSNSGNTFNVTFNNTMDTTAYAMMSQLKQYNRQMAINGVI
jgi:hypothetical protein